MTDSGESGHVDHTGEGKGRSRWRSNGMLVVALFVAWVVAGVVVHDVPCAAQFNPSMLCERVDGTLWRDPSNGCTAGNDHGCPDGECPDSVRVSEPGRRSCSWVIMKKEVPSQSPPPYYTGPFPGRGEIIPVVGQ